MKLQEKILEHKKICDQTREEMNDGPWKSEPDRYEFKAYSYDCLLSRNRFLFVWCGYVAVPKGHPAYEKQRDDIEVSIHGGLTYGGKCHDLICHGGKDDVYWVGFDCGHYEDIIPSMDKYMDNMPSFLKEDDRHYWNLEDVITETTLLAKQLKELEK